MKIRLLLLIFSAFAFVGCLWFGDDTPKDPWTVLKLGGGTLGSVYFPVPDTGYASGGEGVVLKTVNGGKDWIENRRGSENLNTVRFVNTRVGYTFGNSGYPSTGYFLRTSNGGETWTQIRDPFWNVDTSNFARISSGFIRNDTGFILVNKFYEYTILKTTNDWASWKIVYMDTLAKGGIYFIDFPNPSTGYAVGEGALKSLDGGETWVQLNPGNQYSLLSVHFLNSDTGFATGEEGIFRTLDGGANWQIVYPTNRILNLYEIDFLDEKTGYAVGDEIIKTTDGGATWFQSDFKMPSYNGRRSILASIHCPDSKTCFVVGSAIILKHTR